MTRAPQSLPSLLTPPAYHEALLVISLVCVGMLGSFVAVLWQMLT